MSLVASWLSVGVFIGIAKSRGWGQTVRRDGLQAHIVKDGTPTMGGVPFSLVIFLVWLLTIGLPGLSDEKGWAAVLMDTVRKLADGINAIPGLAVLEPHELCIFVYRSVDPALDIGRVADAMTARGWFVGRQAEPAGIHMHLNPVHAETADRYLADLREAADEARAAGPGGAKPVERTY